MIIKPYFIRLPKNDQTPRKKCQELPAHKYLQGKRTGIKVFRTEYKEARKSSVQ